MAGIFISYRRSDTLHIIGRIYDHLVQSFSKDIVFRDVYSMPLGIKFPEFLKEKIKGCNLMIVVIGQEWATSFKKSNLEVDYVQMEIETALSVGIPIIPVTITNRKSLFRSSNMLSPNQLPESIRSITEWNAQNVDTDEYFHYDMSRLINRIKPLVQRDNVNVSTIANRNLIQETVDTAQNWYNEIVEIRGELLNKNLSKKNEDTMSYKYIYTRKYLPRLITIRKLLSSSGETHELAQSIDKFLKIITYTESDDDDFERFARCIPIALNRDSNDPTVLFIYKGDRRGFDEVSYALISICNHAYELLNSKS